MASARLATQLFAKMPNRVGLLADITEALRGADVNIAAIGAYEKDGRGEFMLITDDNTRATEALAALGADITVQEVVVVEMQNRVGALDDAARRIADAGIDIQWVYATAAEGPTATAVFLTADNTKVVELVNS